MQTIEERLDQLEKLNRRLTAAQALLAVGRPTRLNALLPTTAHKRKAPVVSPLLAPPPHGCDRGFTLVGGYPFR